MQDHKKTDKQEKSNLESKTKQSFNEENSLPPVGPTNVSSAVGSESLESQAAVLNRLDKTQRQAW